MPVSYSEDSAGPSTRRSALTGAGNYQTYIDYGAWTKAELMAELEHRGLPKSGNIPTLVARLEESDAA